ncbi:MAG TPA: MFS transporter [Polyangiaceae bacterium]|nr:MFS transporter [Polyangiaceae bacterium]
MDVVASSPKQRLGGIELPRPEVRRALVLSFWDGTFSTVMIALTETFAIAGAVSLKAPTMAIALLGSAPLLLGSLGQYYLPAFIDVQHARKGQVLVGVGLQSFFLCLAALTGFLLAPHSAWAFVAAIILAGVCANVTTASWVSWMGDLVPYEARGRHFAWRNRLFAFVNLSCALTVGLLAANYSTKNAPWTFFTGLFLTAGLCRAISYQMLRRQYEPPASASHRDTDWRARPSKDFKTFCLAHALVQGAAAMSGPFFNVWYLRDLHFNYLALSLTSCSSIAGSIVSLPLWSRLADHFGERTTLRLAGLLVGVVPLPYLFFSSASAIWIINAGAGIAWAGYNLVSFNHMLTASENKNRARLTAYASTVTGTVVFSMTLLGGILATRLPVLFAWQLQTLFLASALVRIGTFSFFFPRFHEYAPRAGQTAQDLFNQMPGYRVGLGLLRNFFRAFRG